MEDPDSPRWLLVSDVDDTLTGDEGGLAAFSQLARSVVLILNSSRPRESVLRTLENLPPAFRPDGWITALGTEISIPGRPTSGWTDGFRDWDRAPVDVVMRAMGAVPHPPEMQTPYKASYAVPKERWDEVTSLLTDISPENRVIASGESDFDVIPAAAGKDRATLWVAEQLGTPLSRLVVAGDSGNDLAMFHVSPRAIAVGNARPELLDQADPRRTFFASRPRAWGVIEGLRHWGAIS
jgi:sucrose-6F-phosphate phosphohydrolase